MLQEIGQARDTPDDIIFDHLQIGRSIPISRWAGRSWARSRPSRAFTRDELFAYMGANYRAGGMTLVASGAVDHDDDRAPGRGKICRACGPAPPATPLPARYVGGDMPRRRAIWNRPISPMRFPACRAPIPTFTSAQVYVMALGGGMSSRLFQEAREKRGLCYSIYAFAQAHQGQRHGRRLYRHRRGGSGARYRRVMAGEMEDLAETRHRGGSRPRQGAVEIGPSDGTGTSRPARRTDRRPDVHSRPRAFRSRR